LGCVKSPVFASTYFYTSADTFSNFLPNYLEISYAFALVLPIKLEFSPFPSMSISISSAYTVSAISKIPEELLLFLYF
jgi:hypothetical protein